VHGQKFGRKLGYPTLNLRLPEDLHSPKHGVYVAQVHVGGKAHPAAAFIGPVHLPKGKGIPQNLQRITLEAHLLNFHKSVYNEEARIEFLQWVREPKAFATLDALKAAIAADVRRTERYFRPGTGNRRKEE
ncbi:MAG: riboflavin kinase, partial [Spirochaetia bacterium]|nr:riboflavin kinase [Spirochaetia bacterium]